MVFFAFIIGFILGGLAFIPTTYLYCKNNEKDKAITALEEEKREYIRAKQELDNFARYDGTGEGQEELE